MEKWEKKSAEIVFKKYSRAVERRDFLLPNGKLVDFYVIQMPSPVSILALTADNEVILTQQFRPGPEQVLLELPGGGCEAGEEPLAAAARELLEETGYSGNLQLVTKCLDCAYNTIDRYCFVATECRRVAEPQPDEHEFIEITTMPLEDFKKHIRTGRMTDVEVAYLGLDFLGLLK